MDNAVSPLLTSRLNNSNISVGNNTQSQQQVQPLNELKQDTFVKSNAVTVGATAAGVAGGGIIGVVKECLKNKPQPQTDKMTVNSIITKFLNKETLSEAESEVLRKLNFNEAVFSELPSDLIEQFKNLCSEELDVGKFTIIRNKGAVRLTSALKERTISRMLGECSADENIFKLFGDDFEQIYNNALKSHTGLLDESGVVKKYLTQTLWTEMLESKDSSDSSFIMKKAGDLMPDHSAFNSVVAELKNSGEAVAKSLNIKQVLKSAGIGAAIVGGLALAGSLIYNKVKESKQTKQSA